MACGPSESLVRLMRKNKRLGLQTPFVGAVVGWFYWKRTIRSVFLE